MKDVLSLFAMLEFRQRRRPLNDSMPSIRRCGTRCGG
jgi:hypothetical protein